MNADELIKIRDEMQLKGNEFAKRKRKYIYLTIPCFIIAFTLFIIAISMFSKEIEQQKDIPTTYFVLTYVSLGFVLLGAITLIIFLALYFLERKYIKKRDLVSYELQGLALKKYQDKK
jgi:uncharacterized BrkB/YihY/UPF0761 family membrane protein